MTASISFQQDRFNLSALILAQRIQSKPVTFNRNLFSLEVLMLTAQGGRLKLSKQEPHAQRKGVTDDLQDSFGIHKRIDRSFYAVTRRSAHSITSAARVLLLQSG
jgi:hypothetical protein